MDFSTVNLIAALVAAAAAFVLGGLWYGPLFGKRWQAGIGLSDEDLAGGNMALIFGTTFVLNVIVALMLSGFMPDQFSVGEGAAFGALVALAFVVPSFGVNYLFSRHSLGFFCINAGFMLVQFVLMGGIIAAWP